MARGRCLETAAQLGLSQEETPSCQWRRTLPGHRQSFPSPMQVHTHCTERQITTRVHLDGARRPPSRSHALEAASPRMTSESCLPLAHCVATLRLRHRYPLADLSRRCNIFPPTSARQQLYRLTEATILWSRRRWPQMVRLLQAARNLAPILQTFRHRTPR
jgi:hypothetical protein